MSHPNPEQRRPGLATWLIKLRTQRPDLTDLALIRMAKRHWIAAEQRQHRRAASRH